MPRVGGLIIDSAPHSVDVRILAPGVRAMPENAALCLSCPKHECQELDWPRPIQTIGVCYNGFVSIHNISGHRESCPQLIVKFCSPEAKGDS
jgi:hypothetical protein